MSDRKPFLRAFAAPFLAVALCASAAAGQNTNLVGLDRIETAQVWEAVGRLDVADAGFCTATLIAPDLVLTAAHCTFRPDDKTPLSARDLTFRAGLRDGRAQAERRVVQIARLEKYTDPDASTSERIGADVALLRLGQPISSHVISPFIVHEGRVPRGAVSVVSYGQGREERPSLQKVCQVIKQGSGLVVMDCDVTFGSSGAPVFVNDQGRYRIASVISGTARVGETRHTMGMALPERIEQLKQAMYVNTPRPAAKVTRLGLGANKDALGAKFIRVKPAP
ncbi:MAG: trypsin-like serine peptidase [Sulfitobacter sp.]